MLIVHLLRVFLIFHGLDDVIVLFLFLASMKRDHYNMDPLLQLAAGVSAIALGSIAYSLVPISESAKNFNYCVEQGCLVGREEWKAAPLDSFQSVAFCNGKVIK